MITPIAPVHAPVIDLKTGLLTSEWLHYYSNHAIQTTYHFPEDGTVTSTVTPEQITEMEKPLNDDGQRNPKYNNSQIVKNSTTGLPMFNVGGTFKTITVT